ncbi:MAG: Mur ligase family protein, partial [Deltaproteobacteria bacterium]|nr:Mur ligase family protein [Deltaproteobacteria bacterium]
MNLDAFENIVFYGKGISTVSCYNFLSKKYTKNYFWIEDTNASSAFDTLKSLGLKKNSTLIVASPGVPLPKIEEMKNFYSAFVSELDLALSFFPNNPKIATTGSAGKTTLVYLLEYLFKDFGFKPRVGGNIGISFLDYVDFKVDSDPLIIEISSYQLEHHQHAFFSHGILVSLFPNHLKRHGSFENYAACKFKLFDFLKPGQTAVVNVDHMYADKLKRQIRTNNLTMFTVSCQKNRSDMLVDYKNLKIVTGDEVFSFPIECVSYFDRFAYAIPILDAFKIPRDKAYESSLKFKPPKFRFDVISKEPIVVNDSKSTSISSLIYSIELMEHLCDKFTLMCGGRLKDGDVLDKLRECITFKTGRFYCVICFGEGSPELTAVCKDIVKTYSFA